jgi:uncharacterized protein YjbI with pentapeptide repeats
MCEYKFVPSQYHRGQERLTEWQCPYPPLVGSSYCIFHIPKYKRKELISKYPHLEPIYELTIGLVGRIELVGTNLDEFALEDYLHLIEPDSPISIVSSSISTLDLESVSTNHRIQVISSKIGRFEGSYSDYMNEFRILETKVSKLKFEETEFHGQVQLAGSIFNETSFTSSIFKNTLLLGDNMPKSFSMSEIRENVGGNGATFKGKTLFLGTIFEGTARFEGAKFKSAVTFFEAEFKDVASFEKARFSVGCQFDAVDFHEAVKFSDTRLGYVSFRSANFHGRTVFDSIVFGHRDTPIFHRNGDLDHTYAEGAEIHKLESVERFANISLIKENFETFSNYSAVFTDITVTNRIEFVECKTSNNINMEQSTVSVYISDIAPTHDNITIVLDKSKISRGELTIQRNSFYQLSDATFGKVDLQPNQVNKPFEYLFFDNTTFDGFDFTKHRNYLRNENWRIEGGILDGRHIQSEHRESTYAKAKEGAKNQGSALSASKFFILEMRSRRDEHLRKAKFGEDLQKQAESFVNLVTNDVFYHTSRYAESPRIVIGWSIITVAIFAQIFAQMSFNLPYVSRVPIRFPINIFGISGIRFEAEYVIFSIQSFTAFVLAGGANVDNPLLRFLASLESFLGAFWIGLFISSLVRSFQK